MFDGLAAREMHSVMSLFRMGILPLCPGTVAARNEAGEISRVPAAVSKAGICRESFFFRNRFLH